MQQVFPTDSKQPSDGLFGKGRIDKRGKYRAKKHIFALKFGELAEKFVPLQRLRRRGVKASLTEHTKQVQQFKVKRKCLKKQVKSQVRFGMH